eukprot:1159761-Pelagomonas_calceolata.AAC.14
MAACSAATRDATPARTACGSLAGPSLSIKIPRSPPPGRSPCGSLRFPSPSRPPAGSGPRLTSPLRRTWACLRGCWRVGRGGVGMAPREAGQGSAMAGCPSSEDGGGSGCCLSGHGPRRVRVVGVAVVAVDLDVGHDDNAGHQAGAGAVAIEGDAGQEAVQRQLHERPSHRRDQRGSAIAQRTQRNKATRLESAHMSTGMTEQSHVASRLCMSPCLLALSEGAGFACVFAASTCLLARSWGAGFACVFACCKHLLKVQGLRPWCPVLASNCQRSRVCALICKASSQAHRLRTFPIHIPDARPFATQQCVNLSLLENNVSGNPALADRQLA